MRAVPVFLLLLGLKAFCHVFYRYRAIWPDGQPRGWWRSLRVIAILNHTSLYEILLVGYAPLGLLWRIAWHGVLPLAEKTARRSATTWGFCPTPPKITVWEMPRTWRP